MKTIEIRNSNKHLADWFLEKLIYLTNGDIAKIRESNFRNGVYYIKYDITDL